MTYKIDGNLSAFESWGGGRETVRMLEDYDSEHDTDCYRQLCDMADELFCEANGVLSSETEVNDWLWYDVPQMPEFAEVFG